MMTIFYSGCRDFTNDACWLQRRGRYLLYYRKVSIIFNPLLVSSFVYDLGYNCNCLFFNRRLCYERSISRWRIISKTSPPSFFLISNAKPSCIGTYLWKSEWRQWKSGKSLDRYELGLQWNKFHLRVPCVNILDRLVTPYIILSSAMHLTSALILFLPSSPPECLHCMLGLPLHINY